MKIIGVDIGFGYTKVTDGRVSQVFKSIVGEAADIQFADALIPHAAAHPRHFEIGGQAYFVGELAETQSRGRGFTLDPGHFIANFAKTLALAGLAPLAGNNDPLNVVTGLPVSFFRRYREQLMALLTGRHVVAVVHADGSREEKTINIDKVRVIPQPFGSMFNLMLNDSGKPASQRFVSDKIGIIDVGFRTADYTISEKTRYSERGSGSSDSGISAAYSAIAAVLQEKSGVNVELYRLNEAVTRGVIKIKGKRYDLTKVVEQAYQQLAAKIASEVNLLWADDWDLDCIVITGGGGATLAPYLSKLLEGEVLPMPTDVDSRMNNVNGYYKYGVNLWGRGAAPAVTPSPAAATAPPAG